jgi:hypothetical protein
MIPAGRGGRWILPAILAGALGLRLFGLKYGLPYVYNPDEVAIMSRALALAKGDMNPHNFLYPSLYFYALLGWEGVSALFAVATRALPSFGAFQREFFVDPTRVVVAGRLFTALLGTATVAATARLAWRLAGARAGLIAGLLLAVAPLHVLNSHYVKHDVPVTLLIVLAYLAYWELWNGPGDRDRAVPAGRDLPTDGAGYRLLVGAAVLTGLAFSTHYYAIFLAVPLAWSAARGARDTSEAITRITIAAAVSAVVFLACSPFILAEPATALRDIRANRQIVVDRAVGEIGYWGNALRYLQLLVLETVGVPTAIAAAIGVAGGLFRSTARTAWLLAFPAPFLLFIFSTYPASRYLVPLTPFLAIFAAITFGSLARRIAPRTVAAVAVAVAAVAAAESLRADAFIRQTDTRTLARDFVTARIAGGSTILLQPYSVVLEATAESLREAVARSGRDMPTKTRFQVDRRPYPSPSYRLIYIGRGLDADKLYMPQEVLDADPLGRLRAEHVAFVVLKRYNDEAPAMQPLTAVLARDGRRLAAFSPYRADADARPEPFLHNTDARITPALERSGPVVEIWQVNIGGGPGT